MTTQLYLKNIPFTSSEADVAEAVLEALRSAPEQKGTPQVGSVSLPINRQRGTICGFGFVSIHTGTLTEDEAVAAVFGTEISGRRLHVDRYVPKERR